jgi:hypothetical protein|tara:strand:+ start:186 stop:404 length:219 start_codon:yes stop_codon:yes gene_type:complete
LFLRSYFPLRRLDEDDDDVEAKQRHNTGEKRAIFYEEKRRKNISRTHMKKRRKNGWIFIFAKNILLFLFSFV